METAELERDALDWAVAKCEGYECQFDDGVSGPWLVPQDGYLHDEIPLSIYRPSTKWNQGGAIIQRELISVINTHGSMWAATTYPVHQVYQDHTEAHFQGIGPTPLIAAMRCYVATKLGDEVDLPAELI